MHTIFVGNSSEWDKWGKSDTCTIGLCKSIIYFGGEGNVGVNTFISPDIKLKSSKNIVKIKPEIAWPGEDAALSHYYIKVRKAGSTDWTLVKDLQLPNI